MQVLSTQPSLTLWRWHRKGFSAVTEVTADVTLELRAGLELSSLMLQCTFSMRRCTM